MMLLKTAQGVVEVLMGGDKRVGVEQDWVWFDVQLLGRSLTERKMRCFGGVENG